MKTYLKNAAAVLVAALFAVPLFAARGKADFSRLVTLGDSFGAGVSSVGLNEAHQRYSWAADLARQVGMDVACTTDHPGCFQIPYISQPGILPELELTSLSPLGYRLKPGLGTPMNLTLPRPYNNLSMDGAEVADLLQVDGDGNEAYNAAIVHRNLGPVVGQALALHPTFIAMWIGGNDAFNGVTAGNPSAMTSVEDFTATYATVLDTLIAGAPDAGMVVGDFPTHLSEVPYTNVVPIVLVDPVTRQPVLNPATGQPIPLIADLGGGNYGPLPAGSLVPLPTSSLIATGMGIPAALKPMLPNLPNVGIPLPDSAVLTPDEVAAIEARLVAFNGVVHSLASARNIPVADISGFLDRAFHGIQLGPIVVNMNYVTGGIVSLDGYHLTDIGYGLFADEFIKTINQAYGTSIPLVPTSMFMANNYPMSSSGLSPVDMLTLQFFGVGVPQFTPEAADALRGKYTPQN